MARHALKWQCFIINSLLTRPIINQEGESPLRQRYNLTKSLPDVPGDKSHRQPGSSAHVPPIGYYRLLFGSLLDCYVIATQQTKPT
jgi:hypothetical protein